MKIFADFHIHSRFARATSKDINLENLYFWAKKKGINILGTGDFTHPLWFEELEKNLEPSEGGLFKLKGKDDNDFYFRFVITGEISLIYFQGGRVRKIHHIVFVPDFKTAKKINTQLSWIGNLASDGRPILGLDSKSLLKIILETNPESFLVPAHAWTPWFGIFGSKSGFDSLEECFQELTKEVFAIETGLSSDPAMNWRLSSLDKITLISNSDAHSPQKIGREANVFEIEPENLSFKEIKRIIKEQDKEKFLFTIEFYPQEGRYYYDGHRNCNVSFSPQESKKQNNICPVCQRPLTIGVLNRVDSLADRPEGFEPEGKIPFKSLIPLPEIIAQALGQKSFNKSVQKEYENLIATFGNEMAVLLDVPIEEISQKSLPKIAQGVKKVREQDLIIKPGFDGQYGEIAIWPENIEKSTQGQISQNTLF